MKYEVPSEDWDRVQETGDVNRIIDYLYLTSIELTKKVKKKDRTIKDLLNRIYESGKV